MATTTLHPNGVMGKPWSFSAKSPAGGVVGPYTTLHLNGVMGKRWAFTAKAAGATRLVYMEGGLRDRVAYWE